MVTAAWRVLVLVLVAVTAACGTEGEARPDGAASGADSGGAPQCLGTFQPTWGVIDPDQPVFSDATHTQQQVTDMFAAAKAASTDAYRAYSAAHRMPDVLECAFCACGCATSIGHVSAVDCFKDLHGFT